jgi:hypothetical protein
MREVNAAIEGNDGNDGNEEVLPPMTWDTAVCPNDGTAPSSAKTQ